MIPKISVAVSGTTRNVGYKTEIAIWPIRDQDNYDRGIPTVRRRDGRRGGRHAERLLPETGTELMRRVAPRPTPSLSFAQIAGHTGGDG